MNTFYPISLEADLGSATSVDDAAYVRLVNTSASAVQVVVANDVENVASFTLAASESVVIWKEKGNTLVATSDVKVTRVGRL